jgi:hypothetical protein
MKGTNFGEKDVIKSNELQKERECDLYNGYGWLVGYTIESPIMA